MALERLSNVASHPVPLLPDCDVCSVGVRVAARFACAAGAGRTGNRPWHGSILHPAFRVRAVRPLQGHFGRMGMDVTMRVHQLAARAALLFVLVHPFLYATPLLNHPRPWDGSGQLTLGLDVTTALTGITSWVLVLIIVLTSIWRDQLPYRYETWRLLHGIGAVVTAVAVTHHTLAAGRYSADPLLAGFWVVLLAVALGSLVKTYLLTPLRQLSRPYEVISVRKLALKTWELTTRPQAGDAMRFVPGQFVWLNVGNSPFSLAENPFSISSAPADRNQLQFVIKEVGDMTRSLPAMKPGTKAYLDGPYGSLTLEHRQATGIALIAGGVGIAPMLSIARQLKTDGDSRPVVIVYGNRVATQIVYEDELVELSEKSRLRVGPCGVRTRSRLARTDWRDRCGHSGPGIQCARHCRLAVPGLWPACHARCG